MKDGAKIFLMLCLLIFGFISCYPQNEVKKPEIKPDSETCKEGTIEALNDLKSGELGLYIYGLPSPRFNTWVRLVAEEYDLKINRRGCIVEEKGICYNQIMKEKIREMYGQDAFTRIDQKLDSLYNLGLGDREPSFKGGDSSYLKYVYCQIEDNLLSDTRKNSPLIITQILINETGKIESFEILFINEIAKQNENYEKTVIQLMENMPDWNPAIENKKGVKSLYRLPFRFQKSKKVAICQ
ncbi:MAG: hypothetical protein DWQ02_13880 [Bacteroidetes bacterium]|nr:MAG: hypothetical protein DWQ02_13880 [Bacteroidota bacterium]